MAEQPAATTILQFEELAAAARQANTAYAEFLRVPAMSAGVYQLPANSRDPQRPHVQDELYFVVRGRAKFAAEGKPRAVGPGSLLYVPAGAEHRFEEIEEDLAILVLFAPAETRPT